LILVLSVPCQANKISESCPLDYSLPPEELISDIALVLRAAEFAAKKHRKQHRKGKKQRPYIGHCIEVARILADSGLVEDPNVLAAAFLHDTVEDTKATPEEIRTRFGPAVEQMVLELTDDKGLERDERWRLQVEHAPKLSPGAKLIKLADKISNVREICSDPPERWDVDRRRLYFEWSKQVVDALGPVNPGLEAHFAKTLAAALTLVAADES
jgi:guanosine-3',5'-bis(diphosphate) 3'-pyrophosphohydrolase